MGNPSKKMATPKFVEANLHCLQFHTEGRWMDYGSIKTPADMETSIQKTMTGEGRFRIVKCHMGKTVVFTGPVSYHD